MNSCLPKLLFICRLMRPFVSLASECLFTIIVTTISSFPDRKQEEDLLLILTIPLTRLETEQKHGQLMWDFIYILVHLCQASPRTGF